MKVERSLSPEKPLLAPQSVSPKFSGASLPRPTRILETSESSKEKRNFSAARPRADEPEPRPLKLQDDDSLFGLSPNSTTLTLDASPFSSPPSSLNGGPFSSTLSYTPSPPSPAFSTPKQPSPPPLTLSAPQAPSMVLPVNGSSMASRPIRVAATLPLMCGAVPSHKSGATPLVVLPVDSDANQARSVTATLNHKCHPSVSDQNKGDRCPASKCPYVYKRKFYGLFVKHVRGQLSKHKSTTHDRKVMHGLIPDNQWCGKCDLPYATLWTRKAHESTCMNSSPSKPLPLEHPRPSDGPDPRTLTRTGSIPIAFATRILPPPNSNPPPPTHLPTLYLPPTQPTHSLLRKNQLL